MKLYWKQCLSKLVQLCVKAVQISNMDCQKMEKHISPLKFANSISWLNASKMEADGSRLLWSLILILSLDIQNKCLIQ